MAACGGRIEAPEADQGFGISVNRWEPANVIKALETGLVDAVQVVYNIFDQNPEDELFPACRELDVAVIARVPFDEGSLTGYARRTAAVARRRLAEHLFHAGESRRNAHRVERLKAVVPEGMDLPELALRFILANPDVSTVIPGMRKERARRAEYRERATASRWI